MTKKIHYYDGYKYQLAEDYSHNVGMIGDEDIVLDFLVLKCDGWLQINKGYAWDGPSGPAIDTSSFMRASLVHDALYQIFRANKLHQDYRKRADKLLLTISLEDKMPWWRAYYSYFAVRLLARKAAAPVSAREPLTAPL